MTAPAERRGFKSLLTAGSEATVTTVAEWTSSL